VALAAFGKPTPSRLDMKFRRKNGVLLKNSGPAAAITLFCGFYVLPLPPV
jgi:hypothetical protein